MRAFWRWRPGGALEYARVEVALGAEERGDVRTAARVERDVEQVQPDALVRKLEDDRAVPALHVARRQAPAAPATRT